MDGSLEPYYPFFNESFPANLVPPNHPGGGPVAHPQSLPTQPIHDHTVLNSHHLQHQHTYHQEPNTFQHQSIPVTTAATTQNGNGDGGMGLSAGAGLGIGGGLISGAAGGTDGFSNDLWATMTMNWAAQDGLDFDGL